MKNFLDKRYQELRVEAIRNESLKPESAYKHIDRYLRDREVKSRDLADDAHTLPQLHALRLSVKSWRYILVEFFSVSSLILVDTQQTLGQINDIDRFIQVLEKELRAQVELRQGDEKKDATGEQTNRPQEAQSATPQSQELQSGQSATPQNANRLSKNNLKVASVSQADDFGLQAILEETVDRRNRLVAGFLEKGHDALPYGFRPGARHSEPQKFAHRARSI
jgi:CHAD domain-containing protein